MAKGTAQSRRLARRALARCKGVAPGLTPGPRAGVCVRCKAGVHEGWTVLATFMHGVAKNRKEVTGQVCGACAAELRAQPTNHAVWPKRELGDSDIQVARLLKRVRNPRRKF